MRYSSPPVSLHQQQSSQASSSGFNAYAAGVPNTHAPHNRQGYAAGSPNPLAGNMGGGGAGPGAPGVQGYQNMGFGGWGAMNDATAQMGVQFGKSAVAAGQDYVEKNVSGGMSLV